MKSNLPITKKQAEIFGLLFLVDGATISISLLLNILDLRVNIPDYFLYIVNCRVHLADGGKNIYH